MDIAPEGTSIQCSTVEELVGDRSRIWILFYNEVTKGKFNHTCQETKECFINSKTVGGQHADHVETSPWPAPCLTSGKRVRTLWMTITCTISDMPFTQSSLFSDSQDKVKKDVGLSPLYCNTRTFSSAELKEPLEESPLSIHLSTDSLVASISGLL